MTCNVPGLTSYYTVKHKVVVRALEKGRSSRELFSMYTYESSAGLVVFPLFAAAAFARAAAALRTLLALANR